MKIRGWKFNQGATPKSFRIPGFFGRSIGKKWDKNHELKAGEIWRHSLTDMFWKLLSLPLSDIPF